MGAAAEERVAAQRGQQALGVEMEGFLLPDPTALQIEEAAGAVARPTPMVGVMGAVEL